MNSPTLTFSARPDLSLNWVIRLASPNPVRQFSTQASSVCSGTWLCTNRVARVGSMPMPSSWAAASRVRLRMSSGAGNSTVIACRSTTQ